MTENKDYELALQVYEIYISSESIIECNEKIKELSKKTNKTSKYLKGLIEEFQDSFSKEQQYKIEYAKKLHKENQNTYIKVTEQLLKMNKEQLKEYIKNNSIGEINVFLDRYIKKINNPNLVEKAKILLKEIDKIYKQIEEEKKEKRKEKIHQDAIKLYEMMINDGIFDYVEFARKYHKIMNMSEEDFYKFMGKNRFAFLKQNYPEEYEYYQRKIQENKMKAFIERQQEIETMLSLLPNNYDIIDYYLKIRMPIDVFRRLCAEILDENQIIKISIFFNKYMDRMSNTIKYSYWARMTNETIINGELVTEAMAEQILKIMEIYKIPSNYFVIFFEKYKKGELDEYFDLLTLMEKYNISTEYFEECFEEYKKGKFEEYLNKRKLN